MIQNIDKEVVKSMLIPLWARAVEQTKDNPIIEDNYALDIIQKLGYGLDYLDIKKCIKSQIGCCLRGRWIDDEVRNICKENNVNIQLIQLGSGLDARYHRLSDIGNIKYWYDLDLESAMSIRKEVLPTSENVTNLSMSMFEEEWMKIMSENKILPIIIIEGVLMYFKESEVQQLIKKIYKYLPNAIFLIDSVSYGFIGKSKKHDVLSKEKHNQLEFLWGVKDKNYLESLFEKIKVDKYIYMSNLKRFDFPFFMKMMCKIPGFNKKFMQRLIRFSFKD